MGTFGDSERLMNTENERGKIDFNPTNFLRCHSKMRNDAADINSRVWQCAFEPKKERSNRTTNTFATCGSNSVCVINAEDGSVKTKYYSKDMKEEFHALAWTSLFTVDGTVRVLAVAGIRSTLHLLHPDNFVCFLEHNLKKRQSIESLIFHPLLPNVLFGAFDNGEVHVWDIGSPHPPDYNCNMRTLQKVHTKRNAYALSFSVHCQMLLCATDVGVVGWVATAQALESTHELKQYEFHFTPQDPSLSITEKEMVDSVEVLGEGKMVATKCVLHSCIYIWDLEKAFGSQKQVVKVTPTHILSWSDTDNYYMNMGSSLKANILACGDDKGNLWVYDTKKIISLPPQKHDCDVILKWPNVQDKCADRKQKLSLGVYDIVVNKAAVSYNGKYIVAVTSTNMVCIWKKDDDHVSKHK